MIAVGTNNDRRVSYLSKAEGRNQDRMKSVSVREVVVMAMSAVMLTVGCVGKKCSIGTNDPEVVSVSPADEAWKVDPSPWESAVCTGRPKQSESQSGFGALIGPGIFCAYILYNLLYQLCTE